MDDFNTSTLYESKNEWGIYLLNILTPLIIEGITSIFDEAQKTCNNQNEKSKYLLTFQKFLQHIPNWKQPIIDKECKRIIEKSKCNYLEELIACVHVIQLKILTAVRVSHTQKKMDIEIPKLDKFIHSVYISVARKVYQNAYLFSKNISELQLQKHKRELEIIVQECILNTIRQSIPIETILKVYVEEPSTEIVEEEVHEVKEPEPKPVVVSDPEPVMPEPKTELPVFEKKPSVGGANLSFNDVDSVLDSSNNRTEEMAPKTIERLEEISNYRHNERKINEEDDDDDGFGETLNISNDDANIVFDSIEEPHNIELKDIEILS